jgi:Spy/CpxP family protein refolding chaperone
MLLALLLCLSHAYAAEHEDDDHGGMMMGMHDGRGRDGARIMRRLPEISERLGLNEQQRDAIEALWYETRAAGIDLEARSDKARLELHRLMTADTLDEKAVSKAFDALAAAETDERRNDLKMLLGVRKSLTAQQWQSLCAMKRGGHGADHDEERGERRERKGERDDD